MIFIGVVGITRTTTSTIVAMISTSFSLMITMSLLLTAVVVPTCSRVCHELILLLLVSLHLLGRKTRLNVKKT
jgi:hypothetical protein